MVGQVDDTEGFFQPKSFDDSIIIPRYWSQTGFCLAPNHISCQPWPNFGHLTSEMWFWSISGPPPVFGMVSLPFFTLRCTQCFEPCNEDFACKCLNTINVAHSYFCYVVWACHCLLLFFIFFPSVSLQKQGLHSWIVCRSSVFPLVVSSAS